MFFLCFGAENAICTHHAKEEKFLFFKQSLHWVLHLDFQRVPRRILILQQNQKYLHRICFGAISV